MSQLDIIKRLLDSYFSDNSDIVWSKYGSDTKQGLAERIINGLGESTIDHEQLLIKYIRHVGYCEGVSFIPTKDSKLFSLAESQELERLAEIADQEDIGVISDQERNQYIRGD